MSPAPEYIVKLVADTRRRQGLPPHIIDPIVCQRVADILRDKPAPAKPKRVRR